MKKLIGKILIIVLPLIAGVVLLIPTYSAYQLEQKQKDVLALAQKDSTSADSLARIEQFNKEYGDELLSAKQRRLKLGLDLRGGMYVTLEADVLKLIEETAQREAVDDVFTEVINKTKQDALQSDEDVIEMFKNNFDQIAVPKKRFLSDYFDFGDQGDIAEIEDKIISHLKDNEKDAIDQAMEVIRQRVDKFGISEPTIQKQGGRRIMLELPGVTNETEMRQLLQTTARLEFKLVKNSDELVKSFFKIDKIVALQNKLKGTGVSLADSLLAAVTTKEVVDTASIAKTEKDKTAVKDSTTVADTTANDSLAKAEEQADTTNPYAGLGEEETRKRYLEDHPFSTLFETYYLPEGKGQKPQQINYIIDAFPKGEYNFSIFEAVLPKFFEILSRPEVQVLLPDDIQIIKGAKPQIVKDQGGKEFKLFSFYGVKADPLLTGEVITNAQATYDPTTNEPVVMMSMNSEGSEKWANITGANINKRIAIVLDEQVYSAPNVINKIVGGSSQITGMANSEEARLLQIVLKAGALKTPVQIIEERVVGPSLGEDSISSGVISALISFLLVVLFMWMYYATGGLVADFAVLLNIIIVVAILAAFQGTLTLPGIAGLILTLGMAVDANILIYERIREELIKGRSIRSAIDEGYHKAMSAIIDSNVTTFITGIILYYFATGPVQGFAMTLMIGILATLFTQILVTRAFIEIMIAKGAVSINFGQPKRKEVNQTISERK